ncbi:hypothetical protein QYE76_033036 [Lolium multiflorum]|uniref:Uncharacterized protein n=1 Tax=Lolium multiflorum TaxID=4521 RepID=A0AAD8VLY0_LOLMU|nr:hypothetical protein QYE76_033036 [Lolium multiflorum]
MGKADVDSSEIQLHEKEISDFFDQLLAKRKEQQALHYELYKNISLQRRITLSQVDDIQAQKEKIADLEKQLAEAHGASSSLATASSELESLRSSHKDLETKLMEADLKREYARSSWRKRKPLGYNEDHRNQFSRDDLIRLVGEDCNDLISACRKICYNLAIKESGTCAVRDLIKRMDALLELVVDQASSARGSAQMSLAMCLARTPDLDIDLTTTGVPPDANVDALLNACSGYDTWIARRIRHDEFYDKVALPADEALEAEYDKEREAEARPIGSGDEGQFTWTSSKDKSKGGATSPKEEVEDYDDEGDVSSPAKETEDEQAQTEDEARSSTAKEK